MADQWRVFVALELPPHVLRALDETQARLRPMLPDRAIRWVRTAGIHLTLKFLGDVPLAQVDQIGAALQVATENHKPFELRAEGLGVFPRPEAARVLWVGVKGNVQALGVLQQAVEREVAPLGYPTERRLFHPHLTLARANRNASRAERQALGALTLADENKLGALATWQVASVSLIRSQLKPAGAVYGRVAESTLAIRNG